MKNNRENEKPDPTEDLNPDWNVLETPLLIYYHACRIRPKGSMLARRKARKKYVEVLDGGTGYETLLKLRERFHTHLDECENEIKKAVRICNMPELPDDMPPRWLRREAGEFEWFGPPTGDVSHRVFTTVPPAENEYRVVMTAPNGLREMPIEGQDPNDPAFFWLMQHRRDLLRLSSFASSHADWKLKMNVLLSVINEFEGDLEAKEPQAYFDFEKVDADSPAFLRKVKAIRQVLRRRPELEDATTNAPIFRAIVEEGLYTTEANKPENTIRRGLKENFDDFFEPNELPTSGEEWGYFFEPQNEGAGVLRKEREWKREGRIN